MTTWEKHEKALKELCEDNDGLTVAMVMGYLYEQGMLASEPPVTKQPSAGCCCFSAVCSLLLQRSSGDLL